MKYNKEKKGFKIGTLFKLLLYIIVVGFVMIMVYQLVKPLGDRLAAIIFVVIFAVINCTINNIDNKIKRNKNLSLQSQIMLVEFAYTTESGKIINTIINKETGEISDAEINKLKEQGLSDDEIIGIETEAETNHVKTGECAALSAIFGVILFAIIYLIIGK